MKKFIILYYENETDENAKQAEIEAKNMGQALTLFYEQFSWEFEPFMCYPLGIRAMFQSNQIPSSLQKDIEP